MADLSCLLAPLPCVPEVTPPEFTLGLCDLFNQLSANVNKPDRETQEKLQQSLSPNATVSQTPPNVSARIPGCNTDIVAVAQAQSESLKAARDIVEAVDNTAEVIAEKTAETIDAVLECPELSEILAILLGMNDLVESCKTNSGAGRDIIASLELELGATLDLLNQSFDLAIDAEKWLQIFKNLGICSVKDAGPVNISEGGTVTQN